jgi:hypothetical protein
MSTQFLEALVTRNSLRPRVQTQGCVGKYVGAINILYHCWVATGCVRELFYSELQETILHHLDGWSASLSSEDFVILSLYMVGRSERTAAPTICFISESSRYRKAARDVIKESGILKSHPDFKTAHMSKDPGWGGELEQLASHHDAEITTRNFPSVKEVFYEESQTMGSHGFTVYVKHATSTRQATATAVKVRGQLYYFTVCHVFFDSLRDIADDSTEASAEPDDDFEIDSDGDAADDEELFSSMTSTGSHSSGSHSKDSSSIEEERESHSSSSSLARSVTPTLQAAELRATQAGRETVNEPSSSLPGEHHSDPLSPASSALDQGSLVPLGHLLHYSIDQDWALIEPSKNLDLSTDLVVIRFSRDRLMITPPDEARVLVRTAGTTGVDGRLLGTPSYIRVPSGTRFQRVHALRLEKGMTEGDCGATVIDHGNEKLLGHIVAGCRSNGFAYVVAAENTISELDKAVEQYQKIPEATSTGLTSGITAGSTGTVTVGTYVGASNKTPEETKDSSGAIPKPSAEVTGNGYGSSPRDFVRLEELCARVDAKLKGT